jgi:uncharacterized damage-inducible protein DinB
MTYYGAKDLAEAFRTVRKNSITVAEEIPEEKYSYQAAPGTRTVAQMLVHVAFVTTFPEQIHGSQPVHTLEGFDFPSALARITAEEQVPRSKAQIIALLHEHGDRFATFLEGLSDDFLAERVTMPTGMTPPSKTRFEMLLGAKEHEMHHRAQLMLIERMLGQVPHLTRQFQERLASRTARS